MLSFVVLPVDYSSPILASLASSANFALEVAEPRPAIAPLPLLSSSALGRLTTSGATNSALVSAIPKLPFLTPLRIAIPTVFFQPAFFRSTSSPDMVAQRTSDQLASSTLRLRVVKSISSWSSGVSKALEFKAPLVAVVEVKNPRSHPVPALDKDKEGEDKGANTVKGDSERNSAAPQPQNCLAAEAILPKAEIPQLFQVQVKGQVVANMPTQAQAATLAERLQQTLERPGFDPTSLQAALIDTIPVGKAGDTVLFEIDNSLSNQFDRNPELIAIGWINSLRTALEVPPIALADAQTKMLDLSPSNRQLKGKASWYDSSLAGNPTATGETFDSTALTAAHPTLPFGTYLKVTNQETKDSVIVRINDRGPYLEDRSLDVSGEAARCLNSEAAGVVPFQAVVMATPKSSTPESSVSQPSAPERSGAEGSGVNQTTETPEEATPSPTP
ncbi:MAG TPA: septal ring lytic transglycosylase RlpA family protein [Coleofasciculaceae cyanobacterium]